MTVVGLVTTVISGGVWAGGPIYNSEVKLTASDGAEEDWFAHSVSVGGDVALVGAYRDGDAGYDSGSAYVFEQCFLPPERVLVGIRREGGADVVLAWTSAVPVDYTVQFRDVMENGTPWSNLSGHVDMPGRDAVMEATNTTDSIEQRYYRIKAANSPLR